MVCVPFSGVCTSDPLRGFVLIFKDSSGAFMCELFFENLKHIIRLFRLFQIRFYSPLLVLAIYRWRKGTFRQCCHRTFLVEVAALSMSLNRIHNMCCFSWFVSPFRFWRCTFKKHVFLSTSIIPYDAPYSNKKVHHIKKNLIEYGAPILCNLPYGAHKKNVVKSMVESRW